MTFQEQYDLVVQMSRLGYKKLGWKYEQAPMIFQFKDGKIQVFLFPYGTAPQDRFKDTINRIHQEKAAEGDFAILLMEAWVVKGHNVDYSRSLKEDPRHEEVIMVNLRMGGEQRMAMIELDRKRRKLKPLPLMNPNEKDSLMAGRFIDEGRTQ